MTTIISPKLNIFFEEQKIINVTEWAKYYFENNITTNKVIPQYDLYQNYCSFVDNKQLTLPLNQWLSILRKWCFKIGFIINPIKTMGTNSKLEYKHTHNSNTEKMLYIHDTTLNNVHDIDCKKR